MIEWPAFSLDLNPIETVRNEMKGWIQNNYGEKFNYDQLRGVVNAAWEQISGQFLKDFGGLCRLAAKQLFEPTVCIRNSS